MQGATGAANAIIGTGTNVAGLTSGLGNATAASQIGQANAYAGGVNNISNLAALYGLQGNNAAPAAKSSLDPNLFYAS
jgi:L-aminopeptidase/D-esterase-like protein